MIRYAICICLCFLLASGQAAADDNKYVNKTVGLSLSKPDDWRFVTASQNLENLKRVQFGTPEFKDAIIKFSTAPLVVVMQYDEPYDGLNPSFKANIRPFGALTDRSGDAVLRIVLPQLQQQFADAKVTQEPKAMVGGRVAAHATINYILKSAEGGEFPTTSEIWIVPAGEFFFMLGAGYSKNNAAERAEIKRIVDSIEFNW